SAGTGNANAAADSSLEEMMTRNRASAQQAGPRLEPQLAAYLAEHVDDSIERRTRGRSRDRDDNSGRRHLDQKIVVECKNTTRINLSTWATETEIQRGNDDAGVGIIVHKRHGKGQPGDQWVTLTLADFVALITGEPKELD